MKKEDIPVPFPSAPFGRMGMQPHIDPLGSYTGIPDDPFEEPVQDADDL